MTDGSTRQTSFQYAIADKKGFIASDRGGGGLSMHEVCNRLRRTRALLVGGSSHKPLVSHTLPVDVVSCTLTTLHEQIMLKKNAGTDHIVVCNTCWWDVSKRWLPARKHPPPRHILHEDGMELSHSQSGAPPGTGSILCESKTQFVVEDTWPLRQRASGQNGKLNPLRMHITTEAGALFDTHPRLKNKALLLDTSIVYPLRRL